MPGLGLGLPGEEGAFPVTGGATTTQVSGESGLQNGAPGLYLCPYSITLQSERPPLAPLLRWLTFGAPQN